MDFLTSNWQVLSIVILAVLSFFFPGVRIAFMKIAQKAFTTRAVESIVIVLLESLAKRTKSKADDNLIAYIKKQLGL